MIPAGDSSAVVISSPTLTLSAEPGALRVTSPILESVGLISEINRYRSAKQVADDGPESGRVTKHLRGLRTAAFEGARRLALSHDGSSAAWSRLAQAAHNDGRLEVASDAAERALQICLDQSAATSPDPPAIYSAAAVLAAIGKPDVAERWLVRLPANAGHRLLLAALAVRRNDLDRALDLVRDDERVSARSLAAWLYLRRGSPDMALHELRLIHRDGEPSTETLVNMAYAYANLGSPKRAVKAARQAVLLSPMDKLASLNLVAYLVNLREFDEALKELHRLDNVRGRDVDLVLERAGVLVKADRFDKALKLLRAAFADPHRRKDGPIGAEIRTNIAMLRFRRGKLSRAETLREIRTQAELTAGRNLNVIAAYLALADRASDALSFAGFVEQAQEWHEPEDLMPVRARIAHWRYDLDEEFRIVSDYAAAKPMDETATALSIYLLSIFKGNYSEAAKRGGLALKRLPMSNMILNNTAYALAMDGNPRQAASVLARMSASGYARDATAGLIAFAAGHAREGLLCYQRALAGMRVEVAEKSERVRVAAMLALNERVAIGRFGMRGPDASAADLLSLELPPHWYEDPNLRLLAEVAEREGSR
ncbi:hypothetical protein [Actinoplanes sp. NBRC 103695]|uniref:tetratricopeptide repeat protein n=1 Tax=Actinoplanes sp. NBRC 103695 TaxID=3032202 RepID=UPI0024A3897F|nr:hypothetical protein [Actinoplanes sp. NBRC 103695]GLY99458.1 hypothetical protein Acsp02_67110 [Actinoplanes sp. NBRC 103695]